jgi:phosphate starvation-inducible PhoH-like protein
VPESTKLAFDDQRSLQLVLGAPEEAKRVAAEVERTTGVRMHSRGGEITLEGGDPEARGLIERYLRQAFRLAQAGRALHVADFARALDVLREAPEGQLGDVFEDVVLARGPSGRAIAPRSLSQKRYVEAMRRNHLVFGAGPAGTGKTYLAVAMAVRRLADKQVRRIILTRPAIEAGENLGFLPGTLEEKVSPYMRPLYDALYDMLDGARVERMLAQGTIEIAPLAYMRGRTLNDAFVILDEAQNTTPQQMKMLLTRIGTGTWCVVTGDPSQQDLGPRVQSGLPHALAVLRGVPGIAQCRFGDQDVMRHPLVQDIVRAYDKAEEQPKP